MVTTVTLLSFSMASGIILANNPATLSLWILSLALTVSCSMGLMVTNWFGLIMFLIYIGGMLVMFSYFVAIQPNQQLEMKKMFISTLSTMTIMAFLTSMFKKPSMPLAMKSNFLPFNLMTGPNLSLYLTIALILFLLMVAVIKISKINKGPLRPFNP